MDDSAETTTFVNELNQPAINIPRAALCFARELAFPDLDIAGYVTRFDDLADGIRPQLEAYVRASKPLVERVDLLSDYLFVQKKFRANQVNYYDPGNSYLNRVLDRRVGIPITLSVVFIEVAQRVGLHAYGVGLPGHFIAGVHESGQQVLIDPFGEGTRLSVPDCARLVRESTGHRGNFNTKWLLPVTPENLLVRILTNLCNAYIQSEDWRSAIPVIQHLLQVQPETDFHLRDLGYLYLYDGSLRLSAQYLEEYLRRVPDAPDFDNVRSSLQIVAGRLALWN